MHGCKVECKWFIRPRGRRSPYY